VTQTRACGLAEPDEKERPDAWAPDPLTTPLSTKAETTTAAPIACLFIVSPSTGRV
jgi:hypothetical protein